MNFRALFSNGLSILFLMLLGSQSRGECYIVTDWLACSDLETSCSSFGTCVLGFHCGTEMKADSGDPDASYYVVSSSDSGQASYSLQSSSTACGTTYFCECQADPSGTSNSCQRDNVNPSAPEDKYWNEPEGANCPPETDGGCCEDGGGCCEDCGGCEGGGGCQGGGGCDCPGGCDS